MVVREIIISPDCSLLCLFPLYAGWESKTSNFDAVYRSVYSFLMTAGRCYVNGEAYLFIANDLFLCFYGQLRQLTVSRVLFRTAFLFPESGSNRYSPMPYPSILSGPFRRAVSPFSPLYITEVF